MPNAFLEFVKENNFKSPQEVLNSDKLTTASDTVQSCADSLRRFVNGEIVIRREELDVYASYPDNEGEYYHIYPEGKTCFWRLPSGNCWEYECSVEECNGFYTLTVDGATEIVWFEEK